MDHPDRRTAKKRWGGYRFYLFISAFLAGCARPLAPPVRSGEPVGVQLMRIEPGYVGTTFRVLCDFESATDLAFIGECPAAKLDPEVAHTGGASLQLPAGAGSFTVKLASLLPPGNFPASWTLAGGYFIAREPTTVQVSYDVGTKVIFRRTVEIQPRKWTPVFLDITPLSDPNGNPPREVGVLRFTPARAEVWCDDVVALDNARSLVSEADHGGGGGGSGAWSVRQRGFWTMIERVGSFNVRVPTPEANGGDGWLVEEANAIRVKMISANGKRLRTIYYDGREYVEGAVKSLAQLPPDQTRALQEQQENPALLAVPEELGRIERNAPGDRDNDGYAESTGAYQFKASGPRFEVVITPRTAKLVRPVLEVAGMPSGRVLANLEGQVVEPVVRLGDGHVLVELPGTIDHAVTVNLRVQ
jgi:hypothetical protein